MTKRSKEVLKWLVNRALADDHARAAEPVPAPKSEPIPEEDQPKKGAKTPPPPPPAPAPEKPLPKLTKPAHDPHFVEPTATEIQAALNELDSPVHCPLT